MLIRFISVSRCKIRVVRLTMSEHIMSNIPFLTDMILQIGPLIGVFWVCWIRTSKFYKTN